jgi:uncharacterized protein YqgC (DUF456 family)
MTTTPLLGLAVLLVLVGLVGTVLPILPGPPLVFGGLLLAAWTDGFTRVGWPTLTVLGLLTFATLAIDLLAASWGARRLRASPHAAVGAALGSVAGLLAGFAGLIVGPFAGAVAGEYWARRDLRRAGKVGLGAWLGLVLGGAAKLALVVVMIGLFATAFVL